MLEVPLTIPMDADLVFRRVKLAAWADAWIEKTKFVKDVGGVAMLCTHPEKHFSGSEPAWKAYDEFLTRVKEMGPWICIPRGIEKLQRLAA
jgi:hypothetical protein